MLKSDNEDIDVFYDSLDSLSGQDSVLVKEKFGFDDYDEIWVNEPVISVKERRKHFLQCMDLVLADTFSKSSSQDRIMKCSDAVSNGCISSTCDQGSEKLIFSGWNAASEAEVLLEELKSRPLEKMNELSGEAQEEFQDFDKNNDRINWWKRFVNMKKGDGVKVRSISSTGTNKTRLIKVRKNKKRWLEFSELYIGQEIKAHKGLIWTMKFSPNDQYLASGGEDGVVRLWRVKSLDTSSICFNSEGGSTGSQPLIEESPLQEFFGHSSDILDLAWSNSDILLSSSMDKTVRSWRLGCDQCLSVFHHKDFVTCIQFNPVDENYFISGSIDGKVRIWGMREERVIDWTDIRDVISAISYQQDGKGFVVGSITGTCRFYVTAGKYFQLEAQIDIRGKKKASSNKITGIQFFQNDCERIMITSEDSKIRILDRNEIVQKYRGLPWSGSQMSGSFTSSGKHIISVGEDSHVYIWNFNDLRSASSEKSKSEYSCEYFSFKGVTVAIPWPGMKAEDRRGCRNYNLPETKLEFVSEVRDTERFSLGNWFFIDGTCRGSTSMTWPEEKLPTYDDDKDRSYDRKISETWGLTIVAAGSDGTIKTFHNFGLPVRL